MKLLKRSIYLAVLCFLTAGFATSGFAQTKTDVIKTYNKAFDYAKNNNYDQAIATYIQTIQMADKVGAEAADIKQKAQDKLAPLHFQQAADLYRTFKKKPTVENIDAVIDGFEQTHKVAQQYNDEDIASRSQSFIPKLYYTKSIILFKQSKYQESLSALDEAINLSPNYSKAYYQKGIVLKNMDKNNLEKTIDMFDKAVEVAKKTNDTQIARKATEAARDELVYQGAQKTEGKDYKEAVPLLERALKYDSESASAYYRLSEAFNKMAMWDKAINNANMALKYEKGGKTDRAKIYFELGTALKNKGNKSAACDAFSQAAYGSFKAPAEHQMEYELKCKTLSQSN